MNKINFKTVFFFNEFMYYIREEPQIMFYLDLQLLLMELSNFY